MTNPRSKSDALTTAFDPDSDERPAGDADTAQRQCVDCRAWSPKTQTVHTLISSKYGWRLQRARDASGGVAYEWRCPTCWQAMKSRPPPK